MKPVFRLERDQAALPEVARQIAESLLRDDPFCLWLQGPLGAGKTTVTGEILRHLGLAERTPVTSPTYTYMNEYPVNKSWYAHLDLYRATASLSSEDLGLVDARRFRGLFIEWPEKVAGDPNLRPTHVLEIATLPGSPADVRVYTLSKTRNPRA
jgi:tRNA threonylcarbamoyl adenosine modification protein YjeE